MDGTPIKIWAESFCLELYDTNEMRGVKLFKKNKKKFILEQLDVDSMEDKMKMNHLISYGQ